MSGLSPRMAADPKNAWRGRGGYKMGALHVLHGEMDPGLLFIVDVIWAQVIASMNRPPILTSHKIQFLQVNLSNAMRNFELCHRDMLAPPCTQTILGYHGLSDITWTNQWQLGWKSLFSHNTHGMSHSRFVHEEPLGAAFHRRGQLEFLWTLQYKC